MSPQRRANVVDENFEDSSSDDPRDYDYEISSSSTLGRGREDGRRSTISTNDERKRGRGVSKRPCPNRNAQMARENRRKKKEYMEKIEHEVKFHVRENKKLTNVVQRQAIELDRLKAEVRYLKNVLRNSSSINSLLKSMNAMLSGKNGGKTGNSNRKGTTREEIIRNGSENENGATWRRNGNRDRIAAKVEDYGFSAVNSNATSIGDSDHTYTTSGDSYADNKLNNNEHLSDIESENFGKIVDDRFLNDIATDSSNFGFNGTVDELPDFDGNLFDSVGNSIIGDSLDRDGDNFVHDVAGNLFENLDNTGICLHVNSGKVSLEFCSICHLNSVNSTD